MIAFSRLFVLSLYLLMSAAVMAVTPLAASAQDSALSAAQKQEIEKLVEKYILDHPEVILEAVQRHQERREQAKKAHAAAALKTFKQELENDPDSPVGGNAKGDVTIVEFFDYRCGYCKRVHATIKKVIAEDKGVRYVFKEFPILGPESMIAARAALAVWNSARDKYAAFHDALMSSRGAMSEASVLATAGKLGINAEQLKTAMADKSIDAMLARNFQLAEALKINGTPAFVIGDQLVPGAVDLATLKKLISEARGS